MIWGFIIGVVVNIEYLPPISQDSTIPCRCKDRGAILMAVSNSFEVSFRLIRTRKKARKIKISLFPILD
ncbi:MAG: hypothetical protein DRP08_02930 [Candidatus Aenigmatarchaeota archaeon]|nr:MAG: hypothetical protein DRP08_02930 [Candidatus Aenigmarchaeota archaeon]